VAGTVKVTAPKRQGWLGALRRGSFPRGSLPQ
jgi:hypothetical protein